MIDRNFISQPLPLSKASDVDAQSETPDGFGGSANNRVIMADFNVFHASSPQRPKSHEETELDEEQLYQDGVEAGKAEAAAIYDQTVKVMEMTLEQLNSRLNNQVKEIEESHARVLMRCLEAVLPDASKQVLRAEMAMILYQVLENGLQGKLTARIHPDNETAKTFLQSKTNHPIEIVEDSASSLEKVTFDWDDSHVEIDPMGAANECLSLLNASLGGVESLEQPVTNFGTERPIEAEFPTNPNMNEKARS